MAVTDSPHYSTAQPGGMAVIAGKHDFPGRIWWVGSAVTGATDSAAYGRNPGTPFATLDYAISAYCTADVEDTIIVLPNHTETVSGSITCDIAGMTILGLGQGTNKPTITIDNTAGEINVTAANVTIKNLRLVSGVNSLVNFFDVDEGNCTIEDVDMVTSSAAEALCFINLATTYDDLSVINCTALQPTDPEGTGAAAGTGFLYCVDSENILIKGCRILGNFETGFVHNKTTKCVNLWVEDCTVRNDLTVPFVLVAAVTGHAAHSYFHTTGAADATVAECIGTIDATFWIGGDCWFSNDSAAGGELMIPSAAACA